MPRKPSNLNRADVKQAIALMEALGKTVTAVKFHPDGTFRVMTKDHVSVPAAADEPNPWDKVFEK